MIRTAFAFITSIVLVPLSLADATQVPLVSQDLHDRIVAVYSGRGSRPLPAGDTLVSWYRNPILLHTVRRDSNEMATGMLRADSLLGIARVIWKDHRPSTADIRWTKGESVAVDVHIVSARDTLRVNGGKPQRWPLPAIPWAIADYGMEDLTLPLLEGLDFRGGSVTIAAYRPYGAKWDTLQVSKRAVGDGFLYELRDAKGKRDWWLVAPNGALVQIRREGQDFERRPLEQTALFAEYRRLRELLNQ